eukprot:109456-Amphidinium_carterae.1
MCEVVRGNRRRAVRERAKEACRAAMCTCRLRNSRNGELWCIVRVRLLSSGDTMLKLEEKEAATCLVTVLVALIRQHGNTCAQHNKKDFCFPCEHILTCCIRLKVLRERELRTCCSPACPPTSTCSHTCSGYDALTEHELGPTGEQ